MWQIVPKPSSVCVHAPSPDTPPGSHLPLLAPSPYLGRGALRPYLPTLARPILFRAHDNKKREMETMSVWVTWPALTKLGTLGIFAGLITLAMEREALFENNLFDAENYARHNADITCDPRSVIARTEDGTCNILSNPSEGSAYMRFGRNVAPQYQHAETDTLLSPNPREVSNVLMSRAEFKPAPSLNFIAAAWIQFMIHDWFDHGPNADADPIQVPMPAGDPKGSGTMSVRRTQADPSRTPDEAAKPQSFRNHN